jgi:hypothetical protein
MGNPLGINGKINGKLRKSNERPFRTALMLALAEFGPKDLALRDLAGVLLHKARQGDMIAMQMLFDRIDGKIPQPHGDGPQAPARLQITWRMPDLAAALQGAAPMIDLTPDIPAIDDDETPDIDSPAAPAPTIENIDTPGLPDPPAAIVDELTIVQPSPDDKAINAARDVEMAVLNAQWLKHPDNPNRQLVDK